MATFTAHNILLDDGTCTKPEVGLLIRDHPWFDSARRLLETLFPGNKSGLRLVDLGCLEGGYATEFARMGFDVLGIEARPENIAACRYVKDRTHLPNLKFVQDDARNVLRYGCFDVSFCCGLFYHLDRPKEFLELLSKATKKLVILQTHFSIPRTVWTDHLPWFVRRKLFSFPSVRFTSTGCFNLSRLTRSEGLRGRWYKEFSNQVPFQGQAQHRWAAWGNRKSFWIQREYLLQVMRTSGFDLVFEQYDGLGSQIAESMLKGAYARESRGTFIGIKTLNPA